MNKLKTNIIIDILMLIAMAIVSGSGYLIEEVCRRGVTFLGMGRRVWVYTFGRALFWLRCL